MSNNLQRYLTADEKSVIQWNDSLKRLSFIIDIMAIVIFLIFAGLFVVIIVSYRTFSRKSRVRDNNNIATPPLFKYNRKNVPPNVSHVTFPSK
tara:strand:- start:60 stop:338 length:279 start_codon:yes stop_codon:yes gene_type:complete